MAVASLYGLECLVINLCAGEGRGTFIWTRDRAAPDPVPLICEWFEVHAFELRWLSAADAGFGVGAHRFVGAPQPLRLGTRLFEFVGYDALRQTVATENPSVVTTPSRATKPGRPTDGSAALARRRQNSSTS